MRVLICGSRDYPDYSLVFQELRKISNVSVVIQGCARGADTIAATVAKSLDIPVESYPADWKKHGLAAGPIRNRQMLTEGKPDLVLAFATKTLTESKGTRNMVEQARAAGVEVKVFEGKNKS